MIRKYLLPALAILGVAFAVYTVRAGNKPVPVSQPVAQPSYAPFPSYVAGSGLVESSTENIAIGTHVAGVVTEVLVKVGDAVKAGESLFKLDDRDLQAELTVRQAAVLSAQATLQKLKNSPRPEEIPVAEAKVAEAQAALTNAKIVLARWERVEDRTAVSPDELREAKLNVQLNEARVRAADADLALLKAGTWKPDIAIAEAEVASAEARVKAAQTNLDRLTVRAPVDGRLLQVKIRPGEFATIGVLQTPLMMIGKTDTLHVRVDVDENEATRVKPDAAAVAFLRGNNAMKAPLKFVRIEPYIVPKRSLTGDTTERVDTRVLQVLYEFDPGVLPAYVGQQVDVYIEAAPIGGGNPSAPANEKAV
jgi:multidrug efflux pump subunit AcrA (membrane-fusion protein)